MKPIKSAPFAEGTSSCRSLVDSSRNRITTRCDLLLAVAFVCMVLSELRRDFGGGMAIVITVRYPPVIDAEGRDITNVQMLE